MSILPSICGETYGRAEGRTSRWSYNASSRNESKRRYNEKHGITIRKWINLAIDDSIEEVILKVFNKA